LLELVVIDALGVCFDSRIHHSRNRHHHRRSKGHAVGGRRGYRGTDAPHVPDDGWQVLTVNSVC